MTTLPDYGGRGGMSRRRVKRAAFTLALVALNFVSWCAVAWRYGLPPLSSHNSYLLLGVGAVNGELLWAGEFWRIITSQFLHVHFAHMAFNTAALFFLGVPLEDALGSLRFALLYLISGSVGQVVGVAAAPALVSSGASQAVMGLAGAAAVHLLGRRESRSALLFVLLAVVGVQLALDVATARTVKAGHWSGLCAGAAVGYILSRRRKI